VSGIPAFDPGHPSVGGVPAWLSTDVRDTPVGQMFILTIRIPNGTTTVVLGKNDAEAWDKQIHDAVSKMNGLIIAPAGSVNTNGHPLG
jgi:hypothetical protein